LEDPTADSNNLVAFVKTKVAIFLKNLVDISKKNCVYFVWQPHVFIYQQCIFESGSHVFESGWQLSASRVYFIWQWCVIW
jgi:hypothetical protein